MKTKHCLPALRSLTLAGSTSLLVLLALVPASLQAQGKKKNPTSKVFVSDVMGEAQIDTGDNIQDLNKRSVYTAQGTIIETKKSDKPEDKGKIFSTMVYSNGTGAFFDQDTKVEIRRFVQEPFTPNRMDMDVEPSISQTNAFIARGVVGLCTSKLVAGSSMNYQTPHGAINIRGKKIVIETSDSETKVSMLEGDSTIRGGELDMGGHMLHAGEQAIIRRRRAGQPSSVEVQRIPPLEIPSLDDKVAQACMAKKTVYFEVKERQLGEAPVAASEVAATEAAASGGAASTENTASGANTNDTASGASPSGAAPVTAFDGPAANSSAGFAPGRGQPNTVQEIVAVPVVPVNLPVQYTVSPARIITPTQPGS